MSKSLTKHLQILDGVDVSLTATSILTKAGSNEMQFELNGDVKVESNDNELIFSPTSTSKHSKAMVGTVRAIANNMMVGVKSGFEKKLKLVGVGYRANATGTKINLSLGFSHPVEYVAPKGITIETPSQTEIVVKGCDKQVVGQVAAEIRKFRPPEPYKGKGVRYSDERVKIKEAKKK